MTAKSKLMIAISAAALYSGDAAADSQGSARVTVDPGHFAAVGKVDPRFLSYNVESVEVTGGNFWAPYRKAGEAEAKRVAGPHGVDFATGSYEKREPIDLIGNTRLRYLTKALGPAYMRVSGSWANSIYFQDDDRPAAPPPPDYQGVLTRAQWAGVVDFAKTTDAKVLTSFATSEGARRADGSWDPAQARKLFEYTAKLGARIDAVELTNEPNARRTPYDENLYARDHAELQNLVRSVSPGTKIVGPGSTGEAGFKLFDTPPAGASTARLLSGNPRPQFDVFSHHFYGSVSERCKSLGERTKTVVTTSPDEALTEAWLSRADQAQAFYSKVRDRYAPGAPIWITETAQAACGGDRWSATFLDTFRFVDQLGRLAKTGASVIFHNTLAASDYSLIDDRTWLPRPNYWAALLWTRLMGEVVLDAGRPAPNIHLYAHCQKGVSGGVALVAVNLDRAKSAVMNAAKPGSIFALSGDRLDAETIRLNGKPLVLTKSEKLPEIRGRAFRNGTVTLPAASVTYFAFPAAGNPACS